MFTNDYFTKAMGYVIDGESRGSKESAMKYLTGSWRDRKRRVISRICFACGGICLLQTPVNE